MKSNETKTYGSIRKIKAYGTCGVILGLAALAVATAQTSFADEVTKAEPTTVAPANTATNLSDSQPAQTQAAQQMIAQANQVQGTVNVTVDNSQVDQAVAQAKNAGVKVVDDSPVDKGTTNTLAETKKAQREIVQDQADQVKNVKQVTENYIQAKSDHQKEVDAVNQKNVQIAAENKALKEAYNNASQQAAQTNQAVADAEAEIKKEFKDAQVTKAEKEIQVDPKSKASYDSYTKVVEGVKKQNQESVAAYVVEKRKKDKDTADFNDKVNKYNQAELDRVEKETAEAKANSTKEAYTKEVVSKYLVFGKDNVKNAKLVSVKGVEYVSQKKYWDRVAAQGNASKVLVSNWDDMVTKDVKEATSSTSGSVLGRLGVGQTAVARYEGLDASYNGKKIVAAEFHYTMKKANSQYGKINLNFDGNPVTTISAGTLVGNEGFEIETEVRYFGEDGKEILPEANKPFLYSVASMNSYGEGTSHVEFVRLSKDDKFIPINGSKVERYGDLVYSKANLEDLDSLGLDKPWDREDSPYAYKGAGIVSTNKRIKFSFGVETNGQESGIVSEWFAFNTDFKTSVITPARHREGKEPEKMHLKLVTVNGVPKPQEKPGEKKPDPLKPATVHVHGYKLSTRPQIAKSVQNEDGVDIDGKYVAKNSLNKWILNVEALPAGRSHTTNLVAGDPTPSGFKPEVDLIKKDNPNWNISFDQNNKLTIKSTEALLKAVNGDLSKAYKIAPFVYWGRPQNDAADYENVFELLVNGGKDKGGYTRKSNIVKISTPGKKNPDPKNPNNPKEPNRDPLKPEKHNYNAAGKLVDGKEMLPEGINYYVSKWTNRPNKGDKSGKEAIAKGFAYIEDYPDEVVNPLESQFKVRDAEGKEVNGLKMYHVLSRETLSKELNDLIDRSGISPKGKFYMWVAQNPEEFYKTYVQTGMDLYFNTPMRNKKAFTGEYKNQTFQVQFGNGYYSNVVVNHVLELKVQKRVYNKLGDGQNLDGKLVKMGDKFYYFLDGAKLPVDRGEALKEYRFYDDFDEKGDEFTGEYKAIAGIDIKLKDGSVIKAGTDLSQYAELKHDKAKGIVEISMKQDFLDKVDNASEFDVDAAIQMKRIAAGTFENTYKNVVNGYEIVSNTVKTSTPEPEKPQPKTPTPAPTAQKPALPQTGENSSTGLAAFGLTMFAALGLFGLKKRKEMN